MTDILVNDIDREALLCGRYDLAIFSCCNEARCTHVPRLLEKADISRVLLLEYEHTVAEINTIGQKSEDYFSKAWKKDRLVMSANEDGPIYKELQQIFLQGPAKIRIAVDYSAMSRLWYAAILNWARYGQNPRFVEIDFLYSRGIYDRDLSPVVIQEIHSLPGYEGDAMRFGESVAILGLGPHGTMAQCVLDQLQPDHLYVYLPQSSPHSYDHKLVRNSNLSLIGQADAVVEVPLDSVQTTFRYLADLALPHLRDSEVVVIPMGPKPHILAAILLATKFREINCLRVSSKHNLVRNSEASGDILATRVVLTE